MSSSRNIAFRVAAAVSCATLMSACVEKELPTQSVASRNARLELVTRVGYTTLAAPLIDVTASYRRTDGKRVVISHTSAPATTGEQRVSFAVNIVPCLADTTREGPRTSCPLRITVALRDSTPAAAFDSIEVGPVDAEPGESKSVPAIDLATERFTVRGWQGDGALNRAGPDLPRSQSTRLAGIVSGTADPVLYVGTTDTLARPILARFQSNAWQFRPSTLPTTATFLDLAALSESEIWIASRAGVYLYNGATYVQPAGVTDSLNSIAAFNTGGAGRFVLAVGARGVVWQSDGTTWRRVSLATNELLADVCITAADEAFIAGGAGTLWRFDGSAWVVTPGGSTSPKFQLECTGRGQAFVTTAAGQFLRWNGSTWVTMPTNGRLSGASVGWGVVSPTEAYAWADSINDRAFYVFNGTTWRETGRLSFIQPPGNSNRAMWADPRGGSAYLMTGFGRIEQVTATGTPRVLSYLPALRDIIVTSPTNAFAVGWNLFLARWDGQTWTIDKPPAIASVRFLHGVWSNGPTNAWAVGNGTILRWNGTAWSSVSDVSRPTVLPIDNYNAVWGEETNVYIVADSTVVRCTASAICNRESVPGAGALYSIWGTSASNLLAVGAGGRIVRFNGTSWTLMSSPTTRTLVRVRGSSANDVWAVGDSVLVHFDGTTWSAVPMTGELASLQSRAPSNLQGVFQLGLWSGGPSDVYLGGEDGRMARFDGTTWRLMPSPTSRRIVGISGVPGFGALAVTEAQSAKSGQTLLRGPGATGGWRAVMTSPGNWP